MSVRDKSIERKSSLVFSRAWGREGMLSDSLIGLRLLLGLMNMFLNYIVVILAQHCKCTVKN